MLKRLVNECLIELAIRTEGPVLVKSGIETVGGPDMAFVRTWRDGEPQAYLPGSSLKGVLRSHAERIARTLGEDKACDPFAKQGALMACGHRFEARKKQREKLDNAQVYAASCPVCRLFGSTWYAGRLATADAYAEGGAPRTEQRDGVGIDRFTGGAARGAKFELEVVINATFGTTLHLRNFELAQLGLVGFLLQDLKDGMLRIGMGKSRGLGKVSAEVGRVRLDFLGPEAPEPANGRLALRGVGHLAPDAAGPYRLARPDEVAVEFGGEWLAGPGRVRSTAMFPGDSFPWAEVAPLWVEYIRAYSPSLEMDPDRLRPKDRGD